MDSNTDSQHIQKTKGQPTYEQLAGKQKSTAQQRRLYKRHMLSCPVVLQNLAGNAIARSRTHNLSNGGCYITLASNELPTDASQIELELKVPRHTPNTYMLESFQTPGRVVRLEKIDPVEIERLGVAIQFAGPLTLQLE